MKTHYIIPIFVSHRGCPHDCVFCNQRAITGEEGYAPSEDIEAKIATYLATMPQRTGIFREVAFYGGSFTGIPHEEQERLLAIAHRYKKLGKINDIRISTRPDYIDGSTLDFLREFGVTTIELGVQTMDAVVLEQSWRGHTAESVIRAVEKIRQYSFTLGLQMMIGLPGDSPAKAQSTACTLASLQPDFVRIYPTLVIAGTQLSHLLQQDRYQPLAIDEAVDWAAVVMLIFAQAAIPVIRVGLQPTEDLAPGRNIIAGPYHPAFRELVEGRIALAMMELLISALVDVPKKAIFHIHPRDMSIFRGQHNRNIDHLRGQYEMECEFKVSDTCPRGSLILEQADEQYVRASISKHSVSVLNKLSQECLGSHLNKMC